MADPRPDASRLFFPPASVFPRTDAYNATAEFQTLTDTETNDARNCEFGLEGSIKKSLGYFKLDSTKLTSSATATGQPINGFYEFNKLGASSTLYVAGAGNTLWQYTAKNAATSFAGVSAASRLLSACATTLPQNHYWQFAQIQDPRSATDDIVVMVNGVDPLLFWNGTGTAVNVSALTSTTYTAISGALISSVSSAKFVIAHERRLIYGGILDASDIDAPAAIDITGFESDGTPAPHRIENRLYIGGSDKEGEVMGLGLLNNEVVIFKRKQIWTAKINPGVPDTSKLIISDKGCIAPYSIANTGDFLIFLSDRGVHAFTGREAILIGEPIRKDLEEKTNLSEWPNAYGFYDKSKNQYKLLMAKEGETEKSLTFILDFNIKTQLNIGNWQPPADFYRGNILADYTDRNGRLRAVFGDYRGFIYETNRGLAAGITNGVNSTATSGGASTLTDTTKTFTTDDNGLEGLFVEILAGTGIGQRRLITSNTANTITVESAWDIAPNATSQYSIAGIPFHCRTKDFDFKAADIVKLFRKANVRTKQAGGYTMDVCYIVDFKFPDEYTCKAVTLNNKALIWNSSLWCEKFRNDPSINIQCVNMRNTPTQRLQGHYLALKFENKRANQPIEIFQYDISLKPIGRRVCE